MSQPSTSSQLIRTPIFRALTEPQMFLGVTYTYFVLNLLVTTEVFLITRSFWALGAALVMHVIGYLACLREPRIFDLWLTKASRCGRVRNYRLWQSNSYSHDRPHTEKKASLEELV